MFRHTATPCLPYLAALITCVDIISFVKMESIKPYFFAMYLRISRAIATIITIPCTIYW